MNQYQHQINQARLKYPLKGLYVVSPIVMCLTDEFGIEDSNSKVFNTNAVSNFVSMLKELHESEGVTINYVKPNSFYADNIDTGI
tara:strand:+ start:362 stop:616 length:255 start_codon:yes stop_codon:yes gene_type:complete